MRVVSSAMYLQMGGDFLVDQDMKLRYVHRSETPPDRPSVTQLIQAVMVCMEYQLKF